MKRTALCGLVATLAVVAPSTALAGLTSAATAAETAVTTPSVSAPATPTASASPAPVTSAPVTSAPVTSAPVTSAPVTTTPYTPTIDVVTINGSGCPISTAEIAMSPDKRTFRVLYGSYTAEAGPGIALTQARKNCQLNLRVSVPEGFTYAIEQAEYSGTADLAQGASATTRANYYFQGMATNASSTRIMNGPLSGEWQTTDIVPISSLIWQPCGEQRNLNVNTEIRVNKGTATTNSSLTLDEIQFLRFRWSRC